MKLVVVTRSSLEPQSFVSQALSKLASAEVLLLRAEGAGLHSLKALLHWTKECHTVPKDAERHWDVNLILFKVCGRGELFFCGPSLGGLPKL